MRKSFFSIIILQIIALSVISCQGIETAKHTLVIEKAMSEFEIPRVQLLHSCGDSSSALSSVEKYYLGENVDSTSIFQAASLSKVVFAYTVMRLVDQKIIDLDHPLMDYYDNHRFRTDENIELAKKLTARLVLSHRSGLPNWAKSPSSDAWPDSEIKFKRAPAIQGDTTELFTYSGEGYAYLQAVVEHLSGLSLNELVDREVFKPLKMTHSHYGWDHVRPNSAYTLKTCAEDYYIFLKAFASGKGLTKETFKEMITPQYEDGDSLRIYGNLPISWGLGVGLTDDGALWHWGDNGGHKAFFALYPEGTASSKEKILVYFSDSRNGLKMLPAILNSFFPKPSLQVHQIPAWLKIHYGD